MSNKRILIVDDEEGIREALSFALEDEYRVLSAKEGKEALDILMNRDIDLVILDIRLPDMNGLEVLREIRRVSFNTLVILITAYDIEKESGRLFFKEKPDEFLAKPLDLDGLMEKISQLLKEKEGENGEKKTLSLSCIQEHVQRMKDSVKRDYKKRTTLLDAQEEIGRSPVYLSRIFKEVTSEKFTSYRIREKIKKAQELLLSDISRPVKQISSQVGYKDTPYFRKVFKKITGFTPGQFRKRYSQKEFY